MKWTLRLKRRKNERGQNASVIEDAQLIWAWMQALTPLDPALSLWRPTNRSRYHAYNSPPITLDQLTNRIMRA